MATPIIRSDHTAVSLGSPRKTPRKANVDSPNKKNVTPVKEVNTPAKEVNSLGGSTEFTPPIKTATPMQTTIPAKMTTPTKAATPIKSTLTPVKTRTPLKTATHMESKSASPARTGITGSPIRSLNLYGSPNRIKSNNASTPAKKEQATEPFNPLLSEPTKKTPRRVDSPQKSSAIASINHRIDEAVSDDDSHYEEHDPPSTVVSTLTDVSTTPVKQLERSIPSRGSVAQLAATSISPAASTVNTKTTPGIFGMTTPPPKTLNSPSVALLFPPTPALAAASRLAETTVRSSPSSNIPGTPHTPRFSIASCGSPVMMDKEIVGSPKLGKVDFYELPDVEAVTNVTGQIFCDDIEADVVADTTNEDNMEDDNVGTLMMGVDSMIVANDENSNDNGVVIEQKDVGPLMHVGSPEQDMELNGNTNAHIVQEESTIEKYADKVFQAGDVPEVTGDNNNSNTFDVNDQTLGQIEEATAIMDENDISSTAIDGNNVIDANHHIEEESSEPILTRNQLMAVLSAEKRTDESGLKEKDTKDTFMDIDKKVSSNFLEKDAPTVADEPKVEAEDDQLDEERVITKDETIESNSPRETTIVERGQSKSIPSSSLSLSATVEIAKSSSMTPRRSSRLIVGHFNKTPASSIKEVKPKSTVKRNKAVVSIEYDSTTSMESEALVTSRKGKTPRAAAVASRTPATAPSRSTRKKATADGGKEASVKNENTTTERRSMRKTAAAINKDIEGSEADGASPSLYPRAARTRKQQQQLSQKVDSDKENNENNTRSNNIVATESSSFVKKTPAKRAVDQVDDADDGRRRSTRARTPARAKA